MHAEDNTAHASNLTPRHGTAYLSWRRHTVQESEHSSSGEVNLNELLGLMNTWVVATRPLDWEVVLPPYAPPLTSWPGQACHT